MLEKLFEQFPEIVKYCEQVQRELELDYLGSETLLLALYEYPNSICQFLLNEYKVTAEEIKDIIKKCIFLRKFELIENKYTNKFFEIISLSDEIKTEVKDDKISDEHLFLSILRVKHTAAQKILELLGLDIDDLIEEYFSIFEKSLPMDEEYQFLVNLTKLAREDKLNPFIGRTKYLERLEKTLSKRQKNNPLLIGSAGVGKSAIVEGLAKRFLDTRPHVNIYYLDLGLLMAGTKYRGDLEQRISDALHNFKFDNDILFIDEIHNILGAGSSEGSLDIANILKPILSRSNLKCIGATTLDEYFKYFEKDKALARRFQNVYIEEPSKEETLEILRGIKSTYEKFHEVTIPDELLSYIIDASAIINTRKLPDKVIDILDEASYLSKTTNNGKLTNAIVDEVIFSFLGIDYHHAISIIRKNLNFNHLKKYYLRYLFNLNLKKTILNLQCNNVLVKDALIEDLQNIFLIKDEAIFNLNLAEYQEPHTISMLLGAPPGYVGFDHGGEFATHILKFPVSIIIISNYELAHEKVKKVINDILINGSITDFQGRHIVFTNTFFIFINNNTNKQSIGFNQQETKGKKILPEIDEVIDDFKIYKLLNKNVHYEKYVQKLFSLGYDIEVNIKDDSHELTTLFEENLDKILAKGKKEKIVISYHENEKRLIF